MLFIQIDCFGFYYSNLFTTSNSEVKEPHLTPTINDWLFCKAPSSVNLYVTLTRAIQYNRKFYSYLGILSTQLMKIIGQKIFLTKWFELNSFLSGRKLIIFARIENKSACQCSIGLFKKALVISLL